VICGRGIGWQFVFSVIRFMEVTLMNEQRKHQRISLDQMIELSMGKETMISALGVNVSEGGMLFQTHRELSPYSKLFVMLSVPDGVKTENLSCEGIVVRSKKHGMHYDVSMKFDGIDEKSSLLLKSWIKNKGK
jgi:hypothetical protein